MVGRIPNKYRVSMVLLRTLSVPSVVSRSSESLCSWTTSSASRSGGDSVLFRIYLMRFGKVLTFMKWRSARTSVMSRITCGFMIYICANLTCVVELLNFMHCSKSGQ